MNCSLILTLCLLFVSTFCRPPHFNEEDVSEAEEAGYDDGDEVVDYSLRDGDESQVNHQDMPNLNQKKSLRHQQIGYNDKNNMQPLRNDPRNARADNDKFSEYKKIDQKFDGSIKSYDNIQTFPNVNLSNRDIKGCDTNDQSGISQYLTNLDASNHRKTSIDTHNNKRAIQLQVEVSDEGNSTFEIKNNSPVQLNDFAQNKYNNELDNTKESSSLLKQNYNRLKSNNKKTYMNKRYDNLRYKANIDRRGVDDTNNQESEIGSRPTDNKVNEPGSEIGECAIKRHVKKFSGEELEELINSLSDDKRDFLIKIIEKDKNCESIFKREITKKADAVDESGYLDNGILDTNRLVESALLNSSDSISRYTETTKNTKTPEVFDGTIIQNRNHLEAIKKESTNILDQAKELNINSNDFLSTTVTVKSQNKGEVSINDISNITLDDIKLKNDLDLKDSQNCYNEEKYSYNHDENLSQVMDDEAQLYKFDHNNKRDTLLDNEINLNDSIKSLEESFPNENAYDDSGQFSENNMMIPLIRVKRKNEESPPVKKRVEATLPERKTYFPCRAENDEKDNDEHNEFEYDGFYDRTYYANNNNEDKEDSNIVHVSKKDNSNSPVNGNMRRY